MYGVCPAVFLFAASVLSAQPLTPVTHPASQKSMADSAKADSTARAAVVTARADTARVVMHHFNHRQQIITGGSIMAALIGVVVVMNNYNPRVPPR
jgi:hypothetical protein